jgi:hypothetical protein
MILVLSVSVDVSYLKKKQKIGFFKTFKTDHSILFIICDMEIGTVRRILPNRPMGSKLKMMISYISAQMMRRNSNRLVVVTGAGLSMSPRQ